MSQPYDTINGMKDIGLSIEDNLMDDLWLDIVGELEQTVAVYQVRDDSVGGLEVYSAGGDGGDTTEEESCRGYQDFVNESEVLVTHPCDIKVINVIVVDIDDIIIDAHTQYLNQNQFKVYLGNPMSGRIYWNP